MLMSQMLISLVALLHVTINELTSLESESKTLKLCALLTRLSKRYLDCTIEIPLTEKEQQSIPPSSEFL